MLLKQQSVKTNIICQTEIPTFIGSWVTNTPSVKIVCPPPKKKSLYFCKNITFFSVDLFIIRKVFLFPANLSISRLRQTVVSLVIYTVKTYNPNVKLALWHLYTFIYFTEDSPDND